MSTVVDVLLTVLVAVIVLFMCFVYYEDFEDYQEQEKQVAECSCIWVDMNSIKRVYKCPDGALFTVNGTIRNAKGE